MYIIDAAQQMHNTPSPAISSDVMIGQTFVPDRDNISRIDVYFAALSRNHKGKIIFSLRKDSRRGRIIFTQSKDALDLKDNHYYSFVFPPVKNSKGKTYFFSIKAVNLEPKDVFVWYYSGDNAYPYGSGFVNKKLLNGDLQFNTYFKVPFTEGFKIALSRITKNKPIVLNWPYFFIFIFAVYFVGVIFLVGLILRI
ncbi:MAG: hypothetical protein HY776_05545 [Actinobacteria bacterium]|nr:hypothetical protein [Actinomycetota bacterium]